MRKLFLRSANKATRWSAYLVLTALATSSGGAMAKSAELSCRGSSHGSRYELQIFVLDSAIVGFKYTSADSSGAGDCLLESYADKQHQVPFMMSEWHASGPATTVSIKSLDGIGDPKDYSRVAISRNDRSIDFEYHMEGSASACGVAGFLPSRVTLVPGMAKCDETPG